MIHRNKREEGEKTIPGMSWKTDNVERQIIIMSILAEGDKGFNDIFGEIEFHSKEWGRQTLNLYLEYMVNEGYIKKVKQGKKREIYSLNREHYYVQKMLPRRIVHGILNLKELNEEDFVKEWLNSIKFAFLNVLQDYVLIGEGNNILRDIGTGEAIPIDHILTGHLSDLLDAVKFNGHILENRIKEGNMDSKKVWDVRNKLHEEIKEEIIEDTKQE